MQTKFNLVKSWWNFSQIFLLIFGSSSVKQVTIPHDSKGTYFISMMFERWYQFYHVNKCTLFSSVLQHATITFNYKMILIQNFTHGLRMPVAGDCTLELISKEKRKYRINPIFTVIIQSHDVKKCLVIMANKNLSSHVACLLSFFFF